MFGSRTAPSNPVRRGTSPAPGASRARGVSPASSRPKSSTEAGGHNKQASKPGGSLRPSSASSSGCNEKEPYSGTSSGNTKAKTNMPEANDAKQSRKGDCLGDPTSSKTRASEVTETEVFEREVELSKEAVEAAKTVLSTLSDEEKASGIFSLREALEIEKAARRIPAEAVIRSEKRAEEAESQIAVIRSECEERIREAHASVERHKEETRRAHVKAAEEVESMQHKLEQTEAFSSQQVEDTHRIAQLEIAEMRELCASEGSAVRDNARQEAEQAQKDELEEARAEAADAEAEAHDLRVELENVSSQLSAMRASIVGMEDERCRARLRAAEVEAAAAREQGRIQQLEEAVATFRESAAAKAKMDKELALKDEELGALNSLVGELEGMLAEQKEEHEAALERLSKAESGSTFQRGEQGGAAGSTVGGEASDNGVLKEMLLATEMAAAQ
ncbi:hypothetical protein CYMTET_28984, partial [Cymbomonas tetramitiformis]